MPRLHWRLRRDGWRVSYKRVERLPRLEGLAACRRKRTRLAVPRVPRRIAEGPNDAQIFDCVSDLFGSGQRFRCLTPIDRCTRECLAITVAHGLPSSAVIAALEVVIADRGRPTRLSLDNGIEFRSPAFDAWAADRGIALQSIRCASPSRTRTSRASTGGSAMTASISSGFCRSSTRSSVSSASAAPSTPPARMMRVAP